MLLAILSACTVGPDYVKPKVETPPAFKEVEGWKKAEPQDNIPCGCWWTIYNDQQLNGLEEQVNISNQNLKAAEAQYREALALVQVARAAYFPTVTAGADASGPALPPNLVLDVTKDSSNQVTTITFPARRPGSPTSGARFAGRSNQASKRPGQRRDLEGVRLCMQGQLAQDYFQLRTLDSQARCSPQTSRSTRNFSN